VDDALGLATRPHRGRSSSTSRWTSCSAGPRSELPPAPARERVEPDTDALDAVAALVRQAAAPVLVLGSDVWSDGADGAAAELAEETRLPVVANGMGRGILPPGHRNLVTRARRRALGGADLVVVAVPRSTSGSASGVRRADGAPRPRSCTWPTTRASWPGT
jgi:acetolactate synthase-1/2/3 large subunit